MKLPNKVNGTVVTIYMIFRFCLRKRTSFGVRGNLFLVLFVICSCFTLSFFSIYRTPSMAFKSEFGFVQPKSVIVEYEDIVPFGARYFLYMKINCPPEVAKKIIHNLNVKEDGQIGQNELEVKYLLRSYFFDPTNEYKPPEWHISTQSKKLRFFILDDGPDRRISNRRIIWDEGQNIVFYKRFAP